MAAFFKVFCLLVEIAVLGTHLFAVAHVGKICLNTPRAPERNLDASASLRPYVWTTIYSHGRKSRHTSGAMCAQYNGGRRRKACPSEDIYIANLNPFTR
jgi:hypothetical protein